jgi:hypothetical protein
MILLRTWLVQRDVCFTLEQPVGFQESKRRSWICQLRRFFHFLSGNASRYQRSIKTYEAESSPLTVTAHFRDYQLPSGPGRDFGTWRGYRSGLGTLTGIRTLLHHQQPLDHLRTAHTKHTALGMPIIPMLAQVASHLRLPQAHAKRPTFLLS